MFPTPFSLFSPSRTPIRWILVHNIFPEVSLLFSFLSHLYFFLASVIFTTLSSRWLINSSVSFNLLSVPSIYFLFQLLYSSSLFDVIHVFSLFLKVCKMLALWIHSFPIFFSFLAVPQHMKLKCQVSDPATVATYTTAVATLDPLTHYVGPGIKSAS